MSIYEEKTLLRSGDTKGNEVIHYPVTKVECIEDFDKTFGEKFDKSFNENIGNLDLGITDLAQATGILPIENGGTGNTTGLASTATKLANSRTVRTNLASTSTANFDGSANITPGVTGTLPITNGGTGNTTGLASTATKLANSRTVRTDLASTSTVNFDGSANITPGVTGTLPIANGGTGGTSITTALANLTNVSSIALGSTASASGTFSTALGNIATASAHASIALGWVATAGGKSSTALGYYATASESSSTALGHRATASGEDSTALGYYATASGSNSTALGYYANASTSNTIQLGSSSDLSTLSCRVALTVTSDERDKIDIEDTKKSLEFLNKIRTVTYKFNHREKYHSDVELEKNEHLPQETLSLADQEKAKIKEKRQKFGIYDYDKTEYKKGTKKGKRGRVGVLAQQVQQSLLDIYGDDNYADLIVNSMYDIDENEIEEGMENTLGVNYSAFIPFLIDGINQLSKTVISLEKRIESLEQNDN